MSKMEELASLGQAVWLDYIRRSFITSGGLQRLIDRGLRGLTSNPSIFEKAIGQSEDYDEAMKDLIAAGASIDEIYNALAVEDIRSAADLFFPVYEKTAGEDGYVSLEVNPLLARDTAGTLAEARRLWKQVDRPNLMIKIPATREGLPAITQAIAEGINVNVTLIFSLNRYAEVIEAYLKGLEIRAGEGLPLDSIASVASFFVSRVDTKVDRLLEEIMRREGPQAELAASLRGQAAVANARLAYQQFESVFNGPRFAGLRAKGARPQRPLWASTSTKNPQYSDILYVQELIAPHTVNTLPTDTLEAFEDHGEVVRTIRAEDYDGQRSVLQSLESLGISMEQVTWELEEEGVAAFAKSFEALIESIIDKRRRLQPEWRPLAKTLGSYSETPEVTRTLEDAASQNIMRRIWERDHTVWSDSPREITNRLGWLDIYDRVDTSLITRFAVQIKQEGFEQVLLLGMGGSSLAPELFARTFTGAGLPLTVVDTTDPTAIGAISERIHPARTLFIVSTKSGGTVETLSLFKYYYNVTAAVLKHEDGKGTPSEVGRHFVAITDPGSGLEKMAREYGFREIFLNDPDIGGRYSALSYFGLVPAALAGVDIDRLIASARRMAAACSPQVPPQENPALQLGVIMGAGALNGRDKLTFVLSPSIASFGDWVEQLIAESTGKAGRGILPVVGEPLGRPAVYGQDRLFVSIQLQDDPAADLIGLKRLEDSGYPVVRLYLNDRYDLGGQFLLWELATAVAGWRLGINPFDQPDVESAKVRAREMMAAYRQAGRLPEDSPLISQNSLRVYARPEDLPPSADGLPQTTHEALTAFLSQGGPDAYVAIQAFIPATEESEAALQALRAQIRDRYHLAATVGFGPRFLHSTGQLHKGDAGRGLFLQLTIDPARDIGIPEEAGRAESPMTFGILELAQALGDRQALLDAGRKVLRVHIAGDPATAIRKLTEYVQGYKE